MRYKVGDKVCFFKYSDKTILEVYEDHYRCNNSSAKWYDKEIDHEKTTIIYPYNNNTVNCTSLDLNKPLQVLRIHIDQYTTDTVNNIFRNVKQDYQILSQTVHNNAVILTVKLHKQPIID